jgi:hypothetical protein
MVILSETFGRGVPAFLMSTRQNCTSLGRDRLVKRDDMVRSCSSRLLISRDSSREEIGRVEGG